MKKLAIEGHKTRGNEVIELLEMLGGKNIQRLNGALSKCYYIIDNQSISVCMSVEDDYVVYTLEEFKEKFPFNVGDMVSIPDYESEVRINAIEWDIYSESILYMVHRVDEKEWYTIKELLYYNDIEDYKNIESKNIKSNKEETITIDDFKANTKEWLIDKLESMSKDNALQSICNLYDELHKLKYPKTYEECCDILNIYYNRNSVCNGLTHKATNYDLKLFSLLEALRQLIVCRDAYWKIVSEYMGLGKAWNPYNTKNKYSIRRAGDKILKYYNISSILEFPTAEMRDIFYNNFKDLIEKCKELL